MRTKGGGIRVMFGLRVKEDGASDRVFKIHNGEDGAGLGPGKKGLGPGRNPVDIENGPIIMNGAAAGLGGKTKF